MTEWRPVMVHYEVSDDGRVRRNGRILKPQSRKGYQRVCLSICNEQHHAAIHRLVALAFLGEVPEGHDVAHINGNRADNRLANLAFKTRAENEADKVRHGTSLHGERNHSAKLSDAKAVEVKRAIQRGEKQTDIARRFNVSPSLICKIGKGVTRHGLQSTFAGDTK